MDGRYVGYVAGHDPLHAFLSGLIRERMGVREPQPAFRVFRLSGSNVVYGYEEKFSGAKIICKFYGPRFGWDRDKAASMARQEYEGLMTLRRSNLIGSPHHVIRPLGFSRDINGVLAVEYYSGEEFSHAIARATHNGRLVELSARIRREVSLGFDAEPYSPDVRHRALRQHPDLAEAVIAGDSGRAASFAARHFSLTEDMLSELHARIRLRSGGEPDARSQGQ